MKRMKRVLGALVCLMLVVCLCGCDSQDYKKAMGLFQKEEYAQAKELFDALEEYKDAAKMSQECVYRMATQAWEEKDYATAMELFGQLGDYEDAREMAQECSYHYATALVEDGEYAAALPLLEELGDYQKSADYLNRAKWGMLYDYIEENGEYNEDLEGMAVSWNVENSDSTENNVYLSATGPDSIALKSYVVTKGTGYAIIRDLEVKVQRGHVGADWSGGFGFGIGDTAKTMEVGGGTFNLSEAGADYEFSYDYYQKQVTNIYGRTTNSSDKSDSTMGGAMTKAWAEMLQTTPNILEETGLPVELTDLGFVSQG